jgi:ribosome-binding factor A
MARVNDTIRRELSDLLMRETRDPRLEGLLSITAVDTSPDLKYARVYVSVMGGEAEKQLAQEGLAAASGFLRRGLAARLTMRYIPELTFERDESIERGTRILELIKEVAPEAGTGEAD